MKRLVKNSGLVEIIDRIDVILELNIEDSSNIVASSNDDMFPGICQFLADVESILKNRHGWTVLDSHVTNRIKSGSHSVYVVAELELADNKVIICTIYLRISDHRNIISEFDYAHLDHVRQVRDKHFKPHSSGFSAEEIVVQVDLDHHYHDALNDITEQLGSLEQSLKVRYRSYLK